MLIRFLIIIFIFCGCSDTSLSSVEQNNSEEIINIHIEKIEYSNSKINFSFRTSQYIDSIRLQTLQINNIKFTENAKLVIKGYLIFLTIYDNSIYDLSNFDQYGNYPRIYTIGLVANDKTYNYNGQLKYRLPFLESNWKWFKSQVGYPRFDTISPSTVNYNIILKFNDTTYSIHKNDSLITTKNFKININSSYSTKNDIDVDFIDFPEGLFDNYSNYLDNEPLHPIELYGNYMYFEKSIYHEFERIIFKKF